MSLSGKERRRSQLQQNLSSAKEASELSQRLKNLEEAFDHNSTLFMESLQNLEMRVNLLIRVLDDMVRGQVRVIGAGPKASIDLSSYYNEYVAMQGLVEAMEALRLREAAAEFHPSVTG